MRIILLLILSYTSQSYAKENATPISFKKTIYTKTIHVEHSQTLKSRLKKEIKITNLKTPSIPIFKSKTCSCDIQAYEYDAKGLISCDLPNDYRVQVTLDCKINKSPETSLSFFMCENFDIYCKD